MYKVPFNNPNKPIAVKLNGDTAACDGLNYVNENTIIMSGNRVFTIYQIVTCDDWATATVVRQGTVLAINQPPLYSLSTSTIVASDNRYHSLTNTDFDADGPVFIQEADMFCNANGDKLKICKEGELWNPPAKSKNNNENMQQVLDQLLETNAGSSLSSFLF